MKSIDLKKRLNRNRPMTSVTIRIPKDVIEDLKLIALGRTDTNRLLFAVFTVRNEKIRIISARGMTVPEMERYQK